MPEPPWEEDADDESAKDDDEANATIEKCQHGHNLVNLFMVVLLQRLIEEINDAGANSQLCHAEETHDVHEHTCQTNELSTQTVEEYLAGEEGQQQGEHVEQHAHLDIHYASMYTFTHNLSLSQFLILSISMVCMDEVGILMIYLKEV